MTNEETTFLFNNLVELVGLDHAIKFYELREELGIDKLIDKKGIDTTTIDHAQLVLMGFYHDNDE